MNEPLSGLHILILEDEFLIAMDVEQLCRDNGAADVTILSSLDDFREPSDGGPVFDVAVVDLMLSGGSTIDFARLLAERRTPFVFASGYNEVDELRRTFPTVALVSKPYSGDELVAAIAAAVDGERA